MTIRLTFFIFLNSVFVQWTNAQMYTPADGPEIFFASAIIRKNKISTLTLRVYEIYKNKSDKKWKRHLRTKIKVFFDTTGVVTKNLSYNLKNNQPNVTDTIPSLNSLNDLRPDRKYDKDSNVIEQYEGGYVSKSYFKYDSLGRIVYHFNYDLGDRSKMLLPRFYRRILKYDAYSRMTEERIIEGEYSAKDTSAYQDKKTIYYDYDGLNLRSVKELIYKTGTFESNDSPKVRIRIHEYQNGIPIRVFYISDENNNYREETTIQRK